MLLSPKTELVITIEPPSPCSIRRGIAASQVCRTPVSMMSMQSCHAWIPTGLLADDRHDARVGQHDVDSAELRDTLVEHRLHSGTIADIGLAGDNPPIQRLHILDGLSEVAFGSPRVGHGVELFADVERDDVSALLRQPHSMRAPHPARSAADECDLALQNTHLDCPQLDVHNSVRGVWRKPAIEGRDAKPYLQRSNVRSHLHDLGRPQTGSPHTTPAAAPLAAQRLPQVTPGMQADHPDPQAGVSQSTDYARTRTRPLCCAAGQRAALGKTALSHALGCGG